MASAKQKTIGHEKLTERIMGGEIDPVYVFFGDQAPLMDSALELLRGAAVGEGADFDFSVYHGDGAAAEEILDSVRTAPMLSARRLVVVKGADRLPPGELKLIEAWLEAGPTGFPPTSCLVLVFPGKKPRIIAGAGALWASFTLDTQNLLRSLGQEALTLGVEITPRAASILVGLVGEDLLVLRNELGKLAAFLGEGGIITPEVVEKHAVRTRYDDVFKLINAFSERSKPKALRALRDLEARREEPLAVLGMMAWRVRLLWRAKELVGQGLSPPELAKRLKLSPGALRFVREQQANFSYEDIERMLGVLAEGDRRLKSSGAPREHTLTGVVLDMCGG